MKNLISNYTFLLLLILTFSFSSCGDDEVINEPLPELSADEISDLQFLREEEKLARDVYAYLGSLYEHIIFENIGASEQRHIDFVLEIMDQYQVEDIGSEEPGVFNNPVIQDLYNRLSSAGEESLLDALIVGATIEDIDINDLDMAINTSNNQDLLDVYEILQCGSRNHIRAFTSQIKQEEGSYTPQYISQQLYDEILQAGHESCNSK